MKTKIEHVSDTAIWVAAYRAREANRPNGAFEDPFVSKLVGDRGEKLIAAIPGAVEMEFAMVLRTTAIDELVRRCVADGVDMVVNLGAGLDTRPYRLDLPATLTWIEVDFAHMIEFKTEKLAGDRPRCKLERIAVDLSDDRARQDLFASLGARAKKTLVITEGLIVYLTNEAAATLARDMANVPTFEYWIQDFRHGKLNKVREAKMSQALKRAPFLFDVVSPIPFFENLGWRLKDKIMMMDEAERIGRPLPVGFPVNLIVKAFPNFFRKMGNKVYGFALYSRRV